MGDIGAPRRQIELEPMPDDLPMVEPSPQTTPAPAPVPEKEPQPA